jgi:hypothetical protein
VTERVEAMRMDILHRCPNNSRALIVARLLLLPAPEVSYTVAAASQARA